MQKLLFKSPILYRSLCVVFAVLFAMSALLTGTLSWMDYSQHKSNEFDTKTLVDNRTVELVKLEKIPDTVNPDKWVPTKNPVANAEFYLYKMNEDGTEQQIGATYITGANGKITLGNLSVGKYYFLETNPSFGFTYDQNDNNKNITKYYFEIQDDTQVVTIKAYNRRIYKDLTISKTVENADGSALTAEQLTQEFEFTVTFVNAKGEVDKGTYKYTIGSGSPQKITSGGSIKLKHGEKAVITGLPVGITYTVLETPVAGYRISSNNHSATILPGKDYIAEFVNTTGTDDGKGSLSISKQVTGTGADVTKPFTFTVTFSEGNVFYYRINGGALQTFLNGNTITLKHDETAEFADLPKGITYTVTEDDYSADGYTAGVVKYTGTTTGGHIKLPFHNHKDEEEKTGTLTITKQVTGTNADKNKEFQFLVVFSDGGTYNYRIDGGDPQSFTSGGMITLKHNQIAVFEKLPLGITYTVSEKDYSADGYTATVKEATGTIAQGDVASVTFVNHKDDEEGEDTDITITKKIDGNFPEADKDKVFKFTLKYTLPSGEEKEEKFELKNGESKTFTLPQGTYYEVIEDNYMQDGYAKGSITNGHGTASGQKIEVLQTNIYIDEIEIEIKGEKTWDLSGSENAKLPDSITVLLKKGDTIVQIAVVKPDANGKWTYTFKAPKYEADGKTEIKYTIEELPVPGYLPSYDTYNIKNTAVKPVTYNPGVKKVLKGDTPKVDGSFQFVLSAMGTAPMPQGSGTTKTVIINGAGSAVFGTISYTTPGTYVYTISEINGNQPGYTYDTTVYIVTVTVGAVDGRLVVQSVTYKANGNPAGEAVFTNTYSEETTPTISTEPTESTGSTISTQPTESTAPSISTEPTESTGSTIGTQPTESTVPSISTEPTESTGSTISTEPPESTAPSVSTEPTESTGSTISTQPTESTDSTVPNDEKVTISGYKTWNHGDNAVSSYPESITIYIKNGDKVVVMREISEENYWKWDIKLNKYDEQGNEIHYTIEEEPVPGYETKIDGYNIINTFKETDDPNGGKTTISGKKYWYHGDNSGSYPQSITIYVKNGSETVASETITAASGWTYSFTLPKYDSAGRIIQYAIDEETVSGYGKYVEGYDLYNSYGYEDGEAPPSTGQGSIWIWVIIMGLSAANLTLLILAGRKKEKAAYKYKH